MTNSSRFLQSYSTNPMYNTKLVVGETGVPADTFRAWERRYGLPKPERAEGGQRLYSERDIATIRWLRDRTNEGLTISQAVALLESEADTPTVTDGPRSFDALRNDLVQALLRFDAPAADSILSEAFALYSLDAVCVNVMQPVLVEIGEMWHAGSASVAQEHFASQFIRRKLLALLNIYDVPEGRATVVAACAAGEQHDLGLLLLALFLVRRNYKVVFLGADVPLDALQQAVAQVHPDVVCISATSPTTGEHAQMTAQMIMAHHPEIVVCIGGQGISARNNHKHGVHLLEGNGVESAEQIGALLLAKRMGM
jgi:MerR family transcriptional regulator, light-induced transcriptional regulator